MDFKTLILLKIPSEATDLEKARIAYIELGRLLSFSTKFQNTDILSMAKMLTDKINLSDVKSNQVNCNLWAQLYSQILTELGIANSVIDKGHKYVEFYIDGQRWVADATAGAYTDLSRIHNHDNTMFFGIALSQGDKHNNYIIYNEKQDKLLNDIDTKYKLLSGREQLNILKDNFLKIKNNEIDIKKMLNADDNVDELRLKLEYLFCKLEVLNDGYYETKDFVYSMEKLLFTEEEMKNIKAVDFKRTNKDLEVDIIQCIYAKTNDGYRYYLVAPNLPVRETTPKDIIKLALLGYSLDEKKIPNVWFPNNFKMGKVSPLLNYRLYNRGIEILIKSSRFLNDYNTTQVRKY